MFWSNNTSRLLPTASGPYTPGCSDVMVGYGKNGIYLRLYYPTSSPKTAEKTSNQRFLWFPTDDTELMGLAKVLKIPYYILKFVIWWNVNPTVPVLYGQKVRTEEDMKCIILSHGLGGSRYIYSKICYDLASHGFLVACIEHRDKSSSCTYYYESQDNAEKDLKTYVDFEHIPLGGSHLRERQQQIQHRMAECLRAINFIVQLNSGIVPKNVLDSVPNTRNNQFRLEYLVGKIDVNNLVMMGHSFGAATALTTFSKSPHLKQCIVLDPWMFPIKDDDLHDKIFGKPVLFINTETFHIATNVNAMAKFMTNQKLQMYTIRQTTHENQTDSVLVAGYWLNLFMKKLDPHEALKINNALIFMFLNEHVGVPRNVETFNKYLEVKSDLYEKGLTKPWQQ
ncbi:unnamed protein product [Diabrotica balteata]|uniref:1-alkyl-2-acetylglycerophosphocholine esterase n=1 Tax=Diabrotica balteata TaxID=107213 RepID=A0A9N9SW78_DIABA|nr:unnamed protein product [Diabrotica balteata]